MKNRKTSKAKKENPWAPLSTRKRNSLIDLEGEEAVEYAERVVDSVGARRSALVSIIARFHRKRAEAELNVLGLLDTVSRVRAAIGDGR